VAKIKLRYVNSYTNSDTGVRWHMFRRKGHKLIALPGLPGSIEFMEAYADALKKTVGAPSVADAGAGRIEAGTLDAMVLAYLKHDDFTKGLSLASQKMRRPILNHFCEFKTPKGRRYGGNPVATLQADRITDFLKGKKRNVQRNNRTAIRAFCDWMVRHKHILADPTADIKLPKSTGKTMGHMTWKEAQIEQYRAHHPLGTAARLAIELMLNIAARRPDAHLIGKQHLSDGKLTWRPHKSLRLSAKQLSIKVMPELQAALDAMPKSDVLAFMTNEYGQPFASAAAFGNRFADWCVAAGLKPVLCDDGRTRNYRAHGLRKAAARLALQAGSLPHEVMALTGHASLAQLQTYIEEFEREKAADIAIEKLIAKQQKIKTGT
jgi:integrase/recombinase XerD